MADELLFRCTVFREQASGEEARTQQAGAV